MLTLRDLPAGGPAQLTRVRQWRQWSAKGDLRSIGFFAVAAAVLGGDVEVSESVQREFLEGLRGAFLGSDAAAVARGLKRYARRCRPELAPALAATLAGLLRSPAQLTALELLDVLARRRDAGPVALGAIAESLSEFLGPPRRTRGLLKGAFQYPGYSDLTESDDGRRERLGHRALQRARRVVEGLRATGADVRALEARLPAPVAPPTKTDLAALAKALATKPARRFRLPLPSGSLSMHTAVDSDIVAERAFAAKCTLEGASRGQATLLTMGEPVKWSPPRSHLATALYAGDAAWLREVFRDFGSDVAQALVTEVWSAGELVSAKALGRDRGPDVLALTSSQDDAAWSFGTDAKKRTVAVLIHTEGLFPGWARQPTKVKVFPR